MIHRLRSAALTFSGALVLSAVTASAGAAPKSECDQGAFAFSATATPDIAGRMTAIDALSAQIPRDGLQAVRGRLDELAGPASDPVGRARVLGRVAERVASMGVHAGAAPVFEMAARALDGHCRPGQRLPWSMWDAAADAWRTALQGREAVTIYTRLLETPGGPPAASRDAIMVLSARGDARRTLELFDAALADQRRALKLAEQVLPPDDPDWAWMHQRMALVFDEWPGHDAEAEAPYREVLRIREAQTPPDPGQRGRARLNLAGYLADLGRFEEAITLARGADRDWSLGGPSLLRLRPLDIVIRAGMQLARVEDVWQAADSAAGIAEHVRGKATEASVHYRMYAAGAALRTARYDDARRHLDAVMATRGALKVPPDTYRIAENMRIESTTRQRGLRLEDLKITTPGWRREKVHRWAREAGGDLEASIAVDPTPEARLTMLAATLKSKSVSYSQAAATFRGAKTVEWRLVGPGEGVVHMRVVALTTEDAFLLLFIRGTTSDRVAAARAELEAGLAVPAVFGVAPLVPAGGGR